MRPGAGNVPTRNPFSKCELELRQRQQAGRLGREGLRASAPGRGSRR